MWEFEVYGTVASEPVDGDDCDGDGSTIAEGDCDDIQWSVPSTLCSALVGDSVDDGPIKVKGQYCLLVR